MRNRLRPQAALDKSGYLGEATIAALASAVGGALSVIRVSGPKSREILESLSGRKAGPHREIRRETLRETVKGPGKSSDVHLPGVLLPSVHLDDAMAVFYEGPKSFTGEDMVEFFLHGGAFSSTRVLEAILNAGANQALPGEFSFRAVRNGKMDLAQAQAVSDLISASNSGAVSLALEKLSGTQSELLTWVAEELRQTAALGELGIDFSDQDIDELGLKRLKERVTLVLEKLQRLSASFERGSKIQEGIKVAFVGLPNVGKSSFFNALLGEDRSIVSEIAGTTRDLVRETLTLFDSKGSSVTLRLEDTAGLRESSTDQIEKIGMERTEKAAREAELILWLVDSSQSSATTHPDLKAQWERIGKPSAKTLGILTKVDLAQAEMAPKHQDFGISTWIRTSSKDETGIREAADAIVSYCQKWVQRDPGEVLLTQLDHRDAVRRAEGDIERALLARETELFASDLKQALHSLSPLIGETVSDDLLGRIFSQFCIGK